MKPSVSLPALSPSAPSSSAASASSTVQTLAVQLEDDIVAEEWLAEVDCVRYLDCFIKNFPSPDARNRKRGIISRRRLETLRLQDYPKLNIKDFEEAKKLNEHVKTVLKYEFDSPQRKTEVNSLRTRLGITPSAQLSDLLPPLSPSPLGKSESAPMFITEHSLVSSNQNEGIFRPTTPSRSKLSYVGTGDVVSSFMHKTHNPQAPLFVVAQVETNGEMSEKKVEVKSDQRSKARRRRSFDNDAWKHINTLRTNAGKSNEASQHLREGFFPDKIDGGKKKKGTRRWSMENKNPAIPKDPSTMGYGSMAAHYNMLQHQMMLVQEHSLSKMKRAIKCDLATFQFYDCGAGINSAKMILYHNEIWYTFSMDTFAGHAVKTQEMVCTDDAQNDPRLDKSYQEIVGVTIRNIIALPVWCQDGSMVGAIELSNRDGEFELEDPELIILRKMAEELAHDLHIKYRDLMSVSHLLDVNSHDHKTATLHNASKVKITHTIDFTPMSPVARSSMESRALREQDGMTVASH